MRKQVAVTAVLLFVLLCAGRPMSAEPVDGVHEMLDRIEKAWETRDIGLLRDQLSDKGVMLIASPSGRAEGAIVLNKGKTLSLMSQRWARTGIQSHRIVGRNIGVSNNIALMELTTSDIGANRQYDVYKTLAIARKEGDSWELCFSMPAIARSVCAVKNIVPASQAEEAGIKPRNVIVAYAGKPIHRASDLVNLVKAHTLVGGERELTLVVRQGMRERTMSVRPGILGIELQDCLLPAEGAFLFGLQRGHPLKTVMHQALAAIKRDDIEGYSDTFSVDGFFVMQPNGPNDKAVFTADEMRGLLAQRVAKIKEVYDFASAEISSVSVIVSGDVALATEQVLIKRKGGNGDKELLPTGLSVYVRQKEGWRAAAGLVLMMPIGIPRAEKK